MDKVIPFPNEYNRYIRTAELSEAKGDRAGALKAYLAAYNLNESIKLNQKIAQLFFDQQDYSQTLQYLEKYIQDYLYHFQQTGTHKESLLMYFESLLNLGRYEDFLDLAKVKLKLSDDQLENEFGIDTASLNQNLENHFNQLTKDLFNLGNFSLEEQVKLASSFYAYDNDNFVEASKLAFVNKYVHPITKSVLVEGLLVKGQKITTDYLFMGNKYALDLSQVRRMKEEPMLADLLAYSETAYKDNPSNQALVMQEVNIDFMYVYPLHQQFISNPSKWVEYYNVFYQMSDTIEEIDQSDQYDFFEKIQSLKLSDDK